VRELVRGLYAETLLVSDRNGRIRPRLCEFEWLEDGRVLKLTLTAGISFHDGTPLNAATAAALLKVIFAKANAPVSYQSVKRIDVSDDRTLLIHLARQEALLPEDLTDARMLKGPEEQIGTGPFVVEGVVAEDAATLRAFPAYSQGRSHVEQIEIKAYPSPRSAWSAMMRGETDMLHEVSRDAAQFVEAESSVRTYPMLRSYVNAVFFNVRHPVLSRREVRQALSYAVDRDAVVREVMRGRAERADGPVWKYHWAYSTAQRTYEYNPELARTKLEAAGLPLRRGTAGEMPSRFHFTCLLMGNDSRFERIAQVLQKQLYDVGVDMRIEAVPLLELMDRFASGRFDAIHGEVISGRSLTWMYRQLRSSPTAQRGKLNTGYTAADGALDRLRETYSESDVKRIVGELQSIFHEDPPGIFVAWPQTSRAISAKIQVPYESNMDVVGRLWRAQWAAMEPAEK
jgi:ABC-type transport system substrate-binding protein